MKIDLTGKIILLTGASGGIGTAIAEEFAKCNASLILTYKSDQEATEKLLQEISIYQGKHSMVQVNLGSSESIYFMMDVIREKYGKLDVLINNAGYKTDNLFLDISDNELKSTINVNFIGPFIIARESAKLMVDCGGGKILFVTSVDAERPGMKRAHYAAAKAAENMLVKNMALELASKNITVNAVAPGAIKSKMTARIMADKNLHDHVVKGIAMGKIGEPEEIASLLLFLASDYSNYTTGSVFLADGGLSLMRGY